MKLLKRIDDCTTLYLDEKTGLAWVENGHTGTGHTCHPNIAASGSVGGMIRLGFWEKTDRTIISHGFIYNIDLFVVSDDLDKLAAEHCRCGGEHSR